MIAQHMRFTAGAVIPTGDFLAHVGDWTGLPPSELLGLMRGSAAVSAGGSDEMERLKTAFAQDPAARELLASDGDPAQVLASLRSLGGEAGAAVSGYLDLVGNRLIDGFDIAEPTALELPDALLRAIRIAVSGEAQAASDVDARIAEVRAQVPAAHQAEFDELLGEARLTYRLRDERGVYSDIWASGLMRRAALAAGRRVASRGRIATPQHMLDASLDEMCALVAGAGGPSADELAKRAEYRATHTAKDVPPFLGPPAPPPPDLAALPPAVGRLMRATCIALGHLFGSSQAQNEEKVLYGLAASKGVYEGPARRVSGPSEFGRIAKGDVLVTESTTEAFNILLPLLGAIVTDNGGLLSHCGDRRARVRHPRRRRDPRGDRTHRRRRPCPRRRGCRRSHGARMKKVVPFAKARETSLYRVEGRGARRRRAPGPPGPARRGALGRLGRGRRLGGGQGH